MNATPLPRAPSLRRRASRAAGIVASLVVLLATATPRAVRAESEVEPLSPVIFFPEPDAEAREDIERVINTSFADVSKAVEAREILVKRFGLVSVPQLVARLESGSNEPEMWNAALAIGTLRRTYGPSHLLWPAIRPLTKVLKTASGDPWRRVFAALALGEFHGREGARRSPTSREGSEEGARLAGEALVEAEKALAAAMADARAEVGAAAALALGKSGGAGAGGLVLDYVRSVGAAAPPETRLASLLALGLLPGQERDEGGLGRALQDSDRRVRAKAALAIGCWAVAERAAFGPAAAGSQAATRAAAYEPLLVPVTNPQLRMAEEDGAEATYARGALALLTGRMATWDDLFAIAIGAATERETAVAAAQGLLFAPAQSSVRAQMAELTGRKNIGTSLKEPVIAAFLVVAGEDGTVEGVRSCREYLRNKGKVPLGRLDFDVRYFAAAGLVRAFQTGRIALDARPAALEALSDAARDTLPMGPVNSRTPQVVLGDVVRPAKSALLGPDATLPKTSSTLLEASIPDPDALLARDPEDTALDRLNDAVRALYNLDGLAPAASGPVGLRTPNKEDQPKRFLKGWLQEHSYFARIDLQRERGRLHAAAPGGGDPRLELPRPAR